MYCFDVDGGRMKRMLGENKDDKSFPASPTVKAYSFMRLFDKVV